MSRPLRLMNKLVSVLLLLISALALSAAVFTHPVATVNVPGAWDKDPDSSDTTLILNSRTAGQEIVVTVVRLKKGATDADQIAEATMKVFKVRLSAAQSLSNGGVKFDDPEVTSAHASMVCTCRGYDARKRIRMVFRVEGSPDQVRSTSIYDHTGQSAETFRTWSSAMLAGVR